jgi:selenocysteine lyase/cysteine desulfurase
MGPYAISLAYFGPYFDDGEPLEEGWISRHGSEDFSGLVNYQDAYQPAALRYEMGERSNFIQVPMMLEALRQIQAWEVDRIQDYCARLSEPAIAELLRHGYQIEKPTFRGSHLFGVRLPARISMDKLRKFLAEERVVVSVRGDSVRVSPYLYNKAADLEKLIRCFEAAGQ